MNDFQFNQQQFAERQEDPREKNCVIRAISFLRNTTPQETIAMFEEFHADGEDPEPWFDNGIKWEAYAVVLGSMGWKPLVPKEGEPFPLPSRALISIYGHCLAIRDGIFFDTALGIRDRDADDMLVLVPPEKERPLRGCKSDGRVRR